MKEFSIKGYKDYDIVFLNNRFFQHYVDVSIIGSSLTYPCYKYGMFLEETHFLYPGIVSDRYQEDIDNLFNSKLTALSESSKLYYHPASSVPKRICSQVFKTARSPEKADIIVIPTPKKDVSELEMWKDVTVFKEPNSKTLLLLSRSYSMEDYPEINESMEDWITRNALVHNTSLKYNKEYLDKYQHATCIYNGIILWYPQKADYIFKVVEGKWNNIVYDTEVYKKVMEKYKKIPTAGQIRSIIAMLKSNNEGMVKTGVMMLTSLDYIHYPHIVQYAMEEGMSSVVKFKLQHLTAYKYMYQYLWDKTKGDTFLELNSQEAKIAKELYADIINKTLSDSIAALKRNTNLSVDIQFNYNIKVPTPNLFNSLEDE